MLRIRRDLLDGRPRPRPSGPPRRGVRRHRRAGRQRPPRAPRAHAQRGPLAHVLRVRPGGAAGPLPRDGRPRRGARRRLPLAHRDRGGPVAHRRRPGLRARRALPAGVAPGPRGGRGAQLPHRRRSGRARSRSRSSSPEGRRRIDAAPWPGVSGRRSRWRTPPRCASRASSRPRSRQRGAGVSGSWTTRSRETSRRPLTCSSGTRRNRSLNPGAHAVQPLGQPGPDLVGSSACSAHAAGHDAPALVGGLGADLVDLEGHRSPGARLPEPRAVAWCRTTTCLWPGSARRPRTLTGDRRPAARSGTE